MTAIPSTYTADHGRAKRVHHPAKPYERQRRPAAPEPDQASGLLSALKNLMSTPLRWINDGDTSTTTDSYLPTHHVPGSQSNGTNGGASMSATVPANKLVTSTRPPRPPISFKASGNLSTSKGQHLRNPEQALPQANGSGATNRSTSKAPLATAHASGAPNGLDSGSKSPQADEPESLDTSGPTVAARKRQYSTRQNILQQYASDTEQANGLIPLAPSPEQSPKRQRRSQWVSEDESGYETKPNMPFSPFAHNSRMVSAHTHRSHSSAGLPQVFRRGGSLPMRGSMFPRASQLSLGRVGMNQSPFNAARILEALDSVSGLPAQGHRPVHARKPIPSFSKRVHPTKYLGDELESDARSPAKPGRPAVEERPATKGTAELTQSKTREELDVSDQEPMSRSRRGSVSSRAPARKRTASVTHQRHLPYSRPRKVSQSIRDKELERHHTIADKLSNLPTDQSLEGGKQDKPSEGKRWGVSYASKPARGSILKASTYTTRVHARARKNVRWKFSALVDDLSDDEDELEQLKNVPPLPLASNGLASSVFDSQPLVPATTTQSTVGTSAVSSTTAATTTATSVAMPSMAFGMPSSTIAPTMPKVTATPAEIPAATTTSQPTGAATSAMPAFGNPPPVSQAFGVAAGSNAAPSAWPSFGAPTSSAASTTQSTATTVPTASALFGSAISTASLKPVDAQPVATPAPSTEADKATLAPTPSFTFGLTPSSSAPAQIKPEPAPISTNLFQLPTASSAVTAVLSAPPASAPEAPASGFFNIKSSEPQPVSSTATAPVTAGAFTGFSFKPASSTGDSAVTKADAAVKPPSFAFGSAASQPATTTAPATSSTTTAAPASMFGSGSATAEFTGFKAPSGQTAAPTTTASTNSLFTSKPTDAAPGSTTSAQPAFGAGSFAFGASSAPTSQPSTMATSATTAPSVAIGSAAVPKPTDSSAASKPAFTFGSATVPSFGSSKPTPEAAPVNTPSISFSFGASNTNGPNNNEGTASVAKPTGFSFGTASNGLSTGFGQTKPPTASGFGFSASTSTTPQMLSTFTFGAPSQPQAPTSTGFTGFGAAAPSANKPDMDDNDMSTDAMESTLAPAPTPSFGGTATGFGFNPPSEIATSSASSPAPLFSRFGQSASATTSGFGGGGLKANPTLGNNATNGSAPGSNGGPSVTFTFGSNSTAPSTSSAFGSSGGNAGTGGGFALQPSSANAAAPTPSGVFGAATAGGNQSRGSSPFTFGGGGGATNPPGTPTGSVPTTPSSSFNRAGTPPVQFAMGTAPQSPSTQGRKFARIRRRLNK
ncbi:hypothetical protein H4R35_002888 [Dimargaris xerosporica]|nr:hypothetical protein H4R35_002888 [Dimargaris xerosporica]